MYPVNYFSHSSSVQNSANCANSTSNTGIIGTIYSINAKGSGFFKAADGTGPIIFIPPQNLGKAVKDSVVEVVITAKNNIGPVGQVVSIVDPRESVPTIRGTIDTIHPNGSGFCRTPAEISLIFIAPKHMQDVSQDDTVELQIIQRPPHPSYPVGKITTIFQRARSHIACIVSSVTYEGINAYSPLLKRNIRLCASPAVPTITKGDRLFCSVDRWNQIPAAIHATARSPIGSIDNVTRDLPYVLKEYALPEAFPRDVLAVNAEPEDVTQREDLGWLECISIDPSSTYNIDDAISVVRNRQGEFQLGVHVADVTAYVPRGGLLDQEARHRCQNVYLPGLCIPILPDAVSHDLCSLQEGVARFAVSVFIQFNAEGQRTHSFFQRSIIENRHAFSYDEALSVLQGNIESPHQHLLTCMAELCQLLRRERQAPELVAQASYHIAHQIVEEFMLQANQIIAEHLSQNQITALFRTHTPTEEGLSSSRTRAIYGVEAIDHAGLAISQYCHFTSPIRRYVDLTTHRLLLNVEPFSEEELSQLALMANETARIGKKAERAMRWIQTLRRVERLDTHQNPILQSPCRAQLTKVLSSSIEFQVTISDNQGELRLTGSLPIAPEEQHLWQPGASVYVLFQAVDLIRQEVQWRFC